MTAKRTRKAGKRKCRRCKVVFDTPDKYVQICPRCMNHCVRCDKELTKENTTIGKGNHKTSCKFCHAELQNTDKRKDARLVKTYGITLNEYEKILQLQSGACYICGKSPSETAYALSVDHKHVKKDKQQNPRETRTRVRGLLCWVCNKAIAKFRDDPARLRKAAEYLERWPAQEILKG